MEYPNGLVVHVGDKVRLCNGDTGRVVISVDTHEYSEGFPKGEWSTLSGGVLVMTDDGALVAIDSNENEDILPADAS